MEKIQHFSHHHQLVLKNLNDKGLGQYFYYCCPVCYLRISELAYCCDDCKFKIHKSCGERPREMVHPFHPQHTLTLRAAQPLDDDKSPRLKCSVCRNSADDELIFQCSDCDFGIDPNCASLMPTKKLGNKMQQSILHKNLTHPHQLIPCDKEKNEKELKCSCCNQYMVQGRLIFVCLECNVFLDESCAQLPQSLIQHPFHPYHPLTLTPKRYLTTTSCGACKLNGFSYLYYCAQCDFQLDLDCAMLTSSSTNHRISNQDGHDQIKIHVMIPTTHPHPMIPCYITKNISRLYFCSACDQPLNDEKGNPICIYVCLECKSFLHESCASLPRALKHPFHLPHPLSLVDNNIPRYGLRGGYECVACTRTWASAGGFLYTCRECNFYLHIKCTFLIPPFINSQVHPKHPLAFLVIKGLLCRSTACELPCCYPLFRCMECRSNFCTHSLPDLPFTVKHKCHLHPLTLTRSRIKDYEGEGDDSEFLCDACEKERRLEDPTYYCAECHYVAHIHCVISEALQIESWSLGDKLGTIKLDIDLDVGEYNAEKKCFFVEDEFGNINIVGDPVLDELDTEIATLHKGVDELKAEQEAVTTQLEALTRQLEVVATQLETKTTKLKQLKERRAEYNLSQRVELKAEHLRLV